MKNFRGLSLIELMLTLAILGILASIALPEYSQHYRRAQRLTAEVELLKLTSALEEYFVINNSYNGANLEKLNFPVLIANGRYQLAINTLENSFFSVQAAPIGQQTADACGILSVNSRGEKSISGMGKSVDCW
jgi:type IV pilus assembly protein PilE